MRKNGQVEAAPNGRTGRQSAAGRHHAAIIKGIRPYFPKKQGENRAKRAVRKAAAAGSGAVRVKAQV